jgi:hypothetical protein
MNFRIAALLPIVFGLGVVGCRADCETNCDDHRACANASEEWRGRDCRDYCEQLEKANQDHCEDQYDALLSCENAQEDICTIAAEQACARQRFAWVNCTGNVLQ